MEMVTTFCGQEHLPLKWGIFPQNPLKCVGSKTLEMCKTSFPKNGVFWIIEGKLLAFAFEEEIYPEGIAKSGTTYNHKKLWKAVHPKGCSKPYDYYP